MTKEKVSGVSVKIKREKSQVVLTIPDTNKLFGVGEFAHSFTHSAYSEEQAKAGLKRVKAEARKWIAKQRAINKIVSGKAGSPGPEIIENL
jgi:hypothetical protein